MKDSKWKRARRFVVPGPRFCERLKDESAEAAIAGRSATAVVCL
jgi:hypothetical protein